jgi:DGQHR domain-containing protein
MADNLLKKLKTSWTKYDSVSVIDIIGNDELDLYLKKEEAIDPPVLCSYLGIENFDDEIPTYWLEVIKEYPKLRKLFTLLAGIFTHYENIEAFANIYSTVNMGGIFKIGDGGKHQTNLRSALVEGGASLTSYRRKLEVPYDFSKIYEQENIGKLFKLVLQERLRRIGHKKDEVETKFYEISYSYGFHDALSLNKQQYKNWLEGKAIFQIKEFKYDLRELQKLYKSITAFKVNQWLDEWNEVDFKMPMRKKPEDHFYVFKIDIRILKRISDVHRRKAQKHRIDDLNVQRGLKEDRSTEIKNYAHKGFPLSTVSDKAREEPENQKLKMPGFLPTAILVNILGSGQKRGNGTIQDKDLVVINEDEKLQIILPDDVFTEEWDPELKPLEIIDGQHRLWAFDETENIDGTFEVAVVAYYDLDRAWQAYLFYVINIKPKKINTSLGYDLYPLLRTQEWLENSKEGLKVYRETRAQELVEAMWIYPESPWFKRISMLGEESSNISQNAFIRALSDSYFKKSRKEISGLFSDVLKKKDEELKWVRAQQAAFLILIWDEIAKTLSIEITKPGDLEWVDKLRKESTQLTIFEKELNLDKAFVSKNSNLSRDQGVTGISMFSNDFFYILANEPGIDFNDIDWDNEIDERQIELNSIDLAINKFRSHSLYTYIQLFAKEVIKFDWRTSSAEFDDLSKSELQKKYRGSGGYREVWNDLLKIFLNSNNDKIRHCSSILDQSK